MYEFHGWITVRARYENIEVYNAREILENITKKIKDYILELNWQHGVLDLRFINGAAHIWTSGYHNHKPIGDYDPVAFFEYIATIAPGSYGILYVIDDEDMVDDNDNKFKAYVLAHGQLTEREDLFLSPFVPTVESFPMD